MITSHNRILRLFAHLESSAIVNDDPVTLWINDLRNPDAMAAQKLWNHFVSRLYEKRAEAVVRGNSPDQVILGSRDMRLLRGRT